jgi:hypothetical protein
MNESQTSLRIYPTPRTDWRPIGTGGLDGQERDLLVPGFSVCARPAWTVAGSDELALSQD